MKELSKIELTSINGGYWHIVWKVASALFVGYSFGYGFGSYDCSCDGARRSEAGPTHNRA